MRTDMTRRGVLLGGAATLAAPRAARAASWPSLSGTTLNLLIIQPHAVAGRLLADLFAKATGGNVELTIVPYDQLGSKATLDVQSGAGAYDVVEYWYVDLGSLAEGGVLTDVTGRLGEPDIALDDFIPPILDPYTLAQGKRWGLPFDGDAHVLFVNTEILGRHGLKAPATWDDYRDNARVITEAEGKAGVYGAAVLGFNVPIIIGCTFANRLAGFGGRFLRPDGTPDLTSESAIAAAQAIVDAAPYALPTPAETAFEQGLPAFLAGKAAQIEFWTDLGVYAQDPKGSKIVDKWQAVQIPVGGTNTKHAAPLDAGFAFGVSSASRHAEAAWTLVRFAASREVQDILLTTVGSGIDPSRKSTLDGAAYKAFAPKLQPSVATALSGTLAWPNSPQAPALLQSLSDELARIVAGTKRPEQALRDAQEQWVRTLRA